MVQRDALAILRQLTKGSWTNDPEDANYSSHWNVAPTPPGEQLSATLPAVAERRTRVGRVKQQVNVRVGTDNLYIDTPNVEAVGPLARLAQQGLKRADLVAPQVVPRAEVPAALTGPFSVPGPGGPLEIRPRQNAYVGRPADLSPGDQVKIS